MWTRGLIGWYEDHGRHDLPWRRTRDPWAILVSEVMLQQTQVSRVLGRWDGFLARWPAPADCASAELSDILRFWQGLGYPRRARALHECARLVTTAGWPRTEAGLRALPGVGVYTARALLLFAWDQDGPPPLDVNVARVAARAGLGVDAGQTTSAHIEAAVTAGRARGTDQRDYVYALFDAGSIHCRSTPRCSTCPLRHTCLYRASPAALTPSRRRAPQRYAGTVRELRGAILAAVLDSDPPRTIAALERRVSSLAAAASAGATRSAFDALVAEGLIDPSALAEPAASAQPR